MEGTHDWAIPLSLVSLFLFSQWPFNILLCCHQSHRWSSWAWLTAKQLFRQESMEQSRNPCRGFRNSQYVNKNHRRSKDREAEEGSSGSPRIEKSQAFQKSPGNGFIYETTSAKTPLLRKLPLSFSTLASSPQSSPSSNKVHRFKSERQKEGGMTRKVHRWLLLPRMRIPSKSQHL